MHDKSPGDECFGPELSDELLWQSVTSKINGHNCAGVTDQMSYQRKDGDDGAAEKKDYHEIACNTHVVVDVFVEEE